MKKAVPDDMCMYVYMCVCVCVCIIGMDDGDGGNSRWMGLCYTGSDVEGWVAGE